MNIQKAFKRFDAKDGIVLSILTIFFISLPTSIMLNSFSIILLGVYWLLTGSYKNYRKFYNKNVLIQVAYYLLFIIGYFFSEDKGNASFQIEQKLGLIIFPIIISTLTIKDKSTYTKAMIIFSFVMLALSLYGLFNGLYYNFSTLRLSTLDINNIMNHNLVKPFHSHATYFSIYISCIIFFLISNYKKSLPFYFKNHYLQIIIILFFLLILFLLSVRMVIISFFILLIFNLISSKSKLTLIVFGITVFIGGFLLTNDKYGDRIKETFTVNSNSLIGSNQENGISQRVFFWNNATQIIKEKPFFGHGSGDANLAFKRQYNQLIKKGNYSDSERKAIEYFRDKQFNAHNQYLQILITLGVLGLSIFLFKYFLFIRHAVLTKNKLFLTILLLFMMCMFTECFYDRQQGIIFFVFMINFFLKKDDYTVLKKSSKK